MRHLLQIQMNNIKKAPQQLGESSEQQNQFSYQQINIADVQDIIEQQQSDSQQQYNYEDVFEDQRREQVMRNLYEDQNLYQIPQKHQQVQQILNRKAKRQEKKQEIKKNQQMKKLRQQNALQFFRKIKLQLMLNFRNSLFQVNRVQKFKQNNIIRLLSYLNIQTLKLYQKIKAKSFRLKKRVQFYELLHNIYKTNTVQMEGNRKYESIWALAQDLGIALRKISFIDISQMQLQTFYNLKYEQVKGKKKKIIKQIDILRNKLQRKATQQQLSNTNFISIQSYSFNPNSLNATQTTTQQSLATNSQPLQTCAQKSERIKKIKRTFRESYCQIYCPVQDNWQLYNMEVLEPQQIKQAKLSVLNNQAVIGFYSTRILHFNQKYRSLQNHRIYKNVQFRDLTIDFSDKIQLVFKRRHRLGCKALYKNIIKQSNIFKIYDIFTQFDKQLIHKQNKRQLDWAKQHFPTSTKQMRISDYFVTPSLVEKYMMLKQNAEPIPNLQFHEQKVYLKLDLQPVSSRMGWVDLGRMIKQDQIPVKTTQNKTKTSTKLYKYSQTEPFKIKINQDGDFILDDEYNSIYVPPHFQIPSGFVLIPNNVQYLCKRNKYKCARVVQGFDVAGMHVVPNNIGYLVQEQYKEDIEKLYKERQQKLALKKQSRKKQNAMTIWRKLFKSIIITQKVHSS